MRQQKNDTRIGKQKRQGWDWISGEEYKKALCMLHTYVFEADFVSNTFYSAKDNWEDIFDDMPSNYEELYERAYERCHLDDRRRIEETFSKEALQQAWNRGEKKCSLECRLQIKGVYTWFYCAVILYGDDRGQLKGVIGCGRDRNTRKEKEALIYHQATHDDSTNIWNWRAGAEILEDYMALEVTSQAAFVLIRIMDFKEINDEYGYMIGEQILKKVAHILEEMIPEEAYLIRYKGGAFVLFMEIDNTEQIRQLLNQIQYRVLESLNVQTVDGEIKVKIIMGISLYPKHGKTTYRLLECANYAVHSIQCKCQAHHSYALYDRVMEVKEQQRQVLREEDVLRWEDIDDIVYVSDPITHELYYVNKVGREYFGMNQCDYQGRKCYEVFQGRPSPCSFCKKGQLKEGESILWEHQNEKLNCKFLVRDKLIKRGGKLLHVELAIDISNKEN